MEVDGPDSPDMMITSVNHQDLNTKQEDHQVIDTELKIKMIFDKLESANNELNLNKKLSLALTAEMMFEKDLEILIRIFEFYKTNKQYQMAQNLFNNLIQNFTFIDTNFFDSQLESFALTIILYNNRLQNEKPNENDASIIACFNKLIQKDDYEFYLNLYQSQTLRTQEKIIVQLLDKYRALFQFSKPSAENEAQSLNDFYKNLATNELKFNLLKYLIKFYSKYLPIYGLKLVDYLLNAEKQCFPSTSSTISELNENKKRSLNLFRKLCVIDLIPSFVNLIENKLDNKTYYRWIEKSLEFYTKFTCNSIFVKNVDFNSQTIEFGYKEVKLIQVRSYF
jgi:hypothetical protein